jgi:hypothetical protein
MFTSRKNTINSKNFENGTSCRFHKTNYKIDNDVVNETESFKYVSEGVYRTSKQWGGIGVNTWCIDRQRPGETVTAFAYWDSFRPVSFKRKRIKKYN